jgi:hypothetical protein
MAVFITGCSVYANAAYLVRDAHLRFFPPFAPGFQGTMNEHLGGEYDNIARALTSGRGFGDPFGTGTGPTAWMPPLFPAFLAVIHWLCQGNVNAVAATVVCLQDLTLMGTGILAVALARRLTGSVWTATGCYVLLLLHSFFLSFQITHDCWFILLCLDVLVFGTVWCRPLERSWMTVAGWGCWGGICALASPVLGFTWGLLVVATGSRARRQAAQALCAALLTILPWMVRNYSQFDRLIPIKSNLPYELYQSQCLAEEGVVSVALFSHHPYNSGREAQEYAQLGEMAYLDAKREQFVESLKTCPETFLEKTFNRFAAATLVYVPFDRFRDARHGVVLWLHHLVQPLPFASLIVILATARRLTTAHWTLLEIYGAFMIPYVLISYYERYTYPLIVVEVPMMACAIGHLRQVLPMWRPL